MDITQVTQGIRTTNIMRQEINWVGRTKKNKVLFLLSHQPDPMYVKQINVLSERYTVDIAYFNRSGYKCFYPAFSNNIEFNFRLGEIVDRQYLKRLFVYLKSIIKLRSILKNNKYDAVFVSNIDTLIFAYLAIGNKRQAKIFLEVPDLRIKAIKNKIARNLLVKAEQCLLKNTDAIVLTSQMFYEKYYKTIYCGKYFFLENKPLKHLLPADNYDSRKSNNSPFVIGVVGLLAHEMPYRTLFKSINEFDDVEIKVYGGGSCQKMIEEYAAMNNKITYYGSYDFFTDAGNIYGSIDALYAVYDTSKSVNNSLALPNKLYEALYFSVPLLASSDSYLGAVIEKFGVGYSVDCNCKRDLVNKIDQLKMSSATLVRNIKSLPESMYLGNEDYKKFVNFIDTVVNS